MNVKNNNNRCLFCFNNFNFIQGVLWFNLVVLGGYKIQGTTKKKFVTNVVEVEMQRRHLYIVHHVVRAANATITYQIKQKIVNNDVVQGFHFIQLARFFQPFSFSQVPDF